MSEEKHQQNTDGENKTGETLTEYKNMDLGEYFHNVMKIMNSITSRIEIDQRKLLDIHSEILHLEG